MELQILRKRAEEIEKRREAASGVSYTVSALRSFLRWLALAVSEELVTQSRAHLRSVLRSAHKGRSKVVEEHAAAGSLT